MFKPFCVYVTFYRGNILPPFYIGSTSIARVELGYHGSPASKKYKELWKEEERNNPSRFKTIIISTHNTRQEAADKESKLQKLLKVNINPLYINIAYWLGGHVNYTGSHTPESRAKISKSRKGKYKGRKQSPEHVAKRFASGKVGKYIRTAELRERVSIVHKGKEAHNKGKPMGEDLKVNLSNKQIKYRFLILTPDNKIVQTDHLPNFCKARGFTKAQISNLRGNFRKNINSRSNGYKILERELLNQPQDLQVE